MVFIQSLRTIWIELYKLDECSEVHEQALLSCDAIHRERRILLKQEIGRMVLFFTDQPSLLAPNTQVNTITDFFRHTNRDESDRWTLLSFSFLLL